MNYCSPTYWITRPDGRSVPLIAVDELPEFIVLHGVPREGYQVDAPGTVLIGGCHYHAGSYHHVTIKSPAGSYVFDGAGNLTAGDTLLWHVNLETLQRLGHRDIPKWYQQMYNVPSLLPKQEPERPVNEMRAFLQGINPIRTHLPPLLEDRERPMANATTASSVKPPIYQPMPIGTNNINTTITATSTLPQWSTASQSLQGITASIPTQRLLQTASETEAVSPPQETTMTMDGKLPYTHSQIIDNPFAGYMSSYPSWNGPLLAMNSERQLGERTYPSESNLSLVGTSIDSGLTTPSSLPALRRVNAMDLRRTNSTRNVATQGQESARPFPYRPGGLPSISSPNLAAEYQSMALSARPSMQSLSSESPAILDFGGRNASGLHYASANLN
ncbi:hypothetical protein KEM54_006421 [Ascosphaera aggregata]|nr:hypothetical protein KEM54_006421 [Ascosphaera aggregata]